jgi:hypothetical protein
LAGLIICSDEGGGAGSALPALLPVAGQTLIEYQVRLARHAGAAHIVVLVDHMPSALVAAFDRLRADNIDIDIARDARDAADRIHPDEQLLVMASGAVAAREIIGAIAASQTPVLLTVNDVPFHQHFERIDAKARWAGIALIDGKLLRATAAILGDWTLAPTLLRTAVQGGAKQLPVTEGAQVALLSDQGGAQAFSNSLARGIQKPSGGWIARTLINPLARRITPLLLAKEVPLDLIVALPLVLVGSSLLLAMTGWLGAAFGVFLLAGIPAAMASIMTSIGARESSLLALFGRFHLPSACFILLVSGWILSGGGQLWGVIVLAAWAGSLMLLMNRSRAEKAWYADAETLGGTMLVAIMLGQPLVGMALVIAHALATRIDERGFGQII